MQTSENKKGGKSRVRMVRRVQNGETSLRFPICIFLLKVVYISVATAFVPLSTRINKKFKSHYYANEADLHVEMQQSAQITRGTESALW